MRGQSGTGANRGGANRGQPKTAIALRSTTWRPWASRLGHAAGRDGQVAPTGGLTPAKIELPTAGLAIKISTGARRPQMFCRQLENETNLGHSGGPGNSTARYQTNLFRTLSANLKASFGGHE